RHSSTSSKLVCCFLTRQTPTGVPVQLTEPSLKVQVSLSQLTFSKSSGPSSFQPGPLPSMNALGRAAGFSSGRARGGMEARQTTAGAARCGNFMRDTPWQRAGEPGCGGSICEGQQVSLECGADAAFFSAFVKREEKKAASAPHSKKAFTPAALSPPARARR